MNEPLHKQPEPAAIEKNSSATSWQEVFTGGRLAMLIAAFLFVLYPGNFFGSVSFFFRDFGLFTYPVAHFSHVSLWRGEVPLWNPLNNSGVPFLAQWNTSVCYPPSLIYMLLPLPWSLNVFCLAHLVFAGFGMYLLARRWTQDPFAASIAGLAFALNGLMLNCLIWTSNLAALSWQPLVVLCVEQAWRLGGRRRIALAAIVGAFQMLAGAPEIILFTWLILAGLWLADAWRDKGRKVVTLRRFVTIVALVTGLSAIQLLPFFDLLLHSQRDTAYVFADAWPMPIWGWANLVVPLFHCSWGALGSYKQYGQYWTSSYYVGIGVVALALIGVWRTRRFKVWWLASASLGGLILALGANGFVYGWLKSIVPLIGIARYPIKFVALPIFAIPLLAAFGFARIRESSSFGNPKRHLYVIAALLLSAIALILASAYWVRKPDDAVPDAIRSGLGRAAFLVATLALVSASTRATTLRLGGLLGFGLLALIGLDLTTVGMGINPVVGVKAFGPLELNMSSRPRHGESRAMLSKDAVQFLGQATTSDPVYYCVGTRGALFENCNIPEDIPKVDGFCSLHLKEEMDIQGLLYEHTNGFPAPLADFLGVAQISTPDSVFAWQQRTNFLPLATAGQRPIFAGPKETLRGLASKQFDPRHTVYLPEEARDHITATNATEARVLSQRFSTQKAHLEVEASGPAIVVLAQSFYHNWRASVDGVPVPLWRVNHSYQGLEIPAGRHQVALVYRDSAFRVGASVSALSLVCCLLLLWKPDGERPITSPLSE